MPCHRLVRAAFCLIISTGTGYSAPVSAEEPCPERPPRLPAAARPSTTIAENLPAEMRARELRLRDKGTSEFIGDVELQRGNQSLSAERLLYDKNTERVDATGNVTFKEASGLSYQTEETHLNLGSRTGYAGSGSFRLEDGSARGDAERIDFEGPDHTRFTRVRYTTCAPGQDDWFLKIKELDLDAGKAIGTAYHATINFQGVPLLYLPYLSFPISDERKSGFLIPRVGHSGNRGTEISAPYYLNLAPQYDDTFTPEYMSKRGLQLQNEFRYLTTRSHGTLQFEGMDNDKLANGDDRAAGTYQHIHAFDPLWSGNVDLRAVSDKQYINDFGDNLGITSQTHLPQNAQLDYHGSEWNFAVRAADYQTIDPTIAPADRPYARLPLINLSLNQPLQPNRVNYYFETEAVNFDRSVGITGGRLNLSPAVALPLSNSYGFITPRISVRHISYALAGTPEDSPSLTRGMFSLDSGLVFERDSRWGERLYTQTLEPRLYYLWIPHKNQDTLPNFDSGTSELTFSNLFRDNRLSGGDRVGDSNQIAAAVTTRFLDETDGTERGRASLGKIYYLEDRLVNLPAGTIGRDASDIAGEATATLLGNWHVRSNILWRPTDGRHTQKYNYYVQYNPAKTSIVNIGKRFARNEIEQTDISTEWPLASRWTFRAHSLYSLREKRNVESFAGVEYNACCWALRVITARRLIFDTSNNNSAKQDNSIMLELELTGLSKLGKVPDSPLRESVFSFPSRPTAPSGSLIP
ncbi:MAG: LPS assembly protein LptD [Sulfuricaulis sp.]|uniref:LPS-assembly protein LptD n=1 Tax=Sulfuricaulis sp. TaxID=2003553 RepID=UPI0025DE7217|nr:LPS assembly protein LptD [Sulfuricaulis sp.]MCR4346074.1 LPS assembly protein LptD [Sulfuricaulis sp.]